MERGCSKWWKWRVHERHIAAFCKGVRFEVDPPFMRAGHCHCFRCRKHSGTFGLTQARVKREQFRLLQGAELIRVYGTGQGAVKAFCTARGSSLFGGTWPDGPRVSIRMGAFDDDPGIEPEFHTFVGSRAVGSDRGRAAAVSTSLDIRTP